MPSERRAQHIVDSQFAGVNEFSLPPGRERVTIGNGVELASPGNSGMETQLTLGNDAALLFIHGHFHSRGEWSPFALNLHALARLLEAVMTAEATEKPVCVVG